MSYAKELDEVLGKVAEADGEDVMGYLLKRGFCLLSDVHFHAGSSAKDVTIEQLKERIADLESAILVAHKTGMWGPIEDAYAAGGHPCLKHRQG